MLYINRNLALLHLSQNEKTLVNFKVTNGFINHILTANRLAKNMHTEFCLAYVIFM